MNVAVGEGGDVLLMMFADDAVVIGVDAAVDEDMFDPSTEDAGEVQLEELGEFVGEEGEEAVEEEEED